MTAKEMGIACLIAYVCFLTWAIFSRADTLDLKEASCVMLQSTILTSYSKHHNLDLVKPYLKQYVTTCTMPIEQSLLYIADRPIYTGGS